MERQEKLEFKVTFDYRGSWNIYETLSQENKQNFKPEVGGCWYQTVVSIFTSLVTNGIGKSALCVWASWKTVQAYFPVLCGELSIVALLEFFKHPSYKFSAMSLNIFFYFMKSMLSLFYKYYF